MTLTAWLIARGWAAAAGLVVGYILGRADDLTDRGRQ
jgi:hypothetical protein